MDKLFNEAQQHVQKTLQVSDEAVYQFHDHVMNTLPAVSKRSIQNIWTKNVARVLAIVGMGAFIVIQAKEMLTGHSSVQHIDQSGQTLQTSPSTERQSDSWSVDSIWIDIYNFR